MKRVNITALKPEHIGSTTCWCVCDVWSGSVLFDQACLFEYIVYDSILWICIATDNPKNPKNADIFFISQQKHMLWYSLEAPRRGASNEYPQHLFSSINKKNIMWIPPLICSYEYVIIMGSSERKRLIIINTGMNFGFVHFIFMCKRRWNSHKLNKARRMF